MNYLGQNIRILRKLTSTDQAELAQYIKVNRPTVSHYENSKSKPDYEAMNLLVRFFNKMKKANVSFEFLVNNDLSQWDESKIKDAIFVKPIMKGSLETYSNSELELKQKIIELEELNKHYLDTVESQANLIKILTEKCRKNQ